MIGGRRRLAGSSVTAQVRADHSVPGRDDQRRDPMPCGVRAWMTVQQQHRRSFTAPAAVQDDAGTDVAIPLSEIIEHDLIVPRQHRGGRTGAPFADG